MRETELSGGWGQKHIQKFGTPKSARVSFTKIGFDFQSGQQKAVFRPHFLELEWYRSGAGAAWERWEQGRSVSCIKLEAAWEWCRSGSNKGVGAIKEWELHISGSGLGVRAAKSIKSN